MIKKHIKGYAKDTLTLGITGVGLGLGASIAGESAAPLGSLSKGIGSLGNIVALKAGIGILSDTNKSLKKKMRY